MPALAAAGVHAGTIGTSLATVGAAVPSGKQQRLDFIRVCNTTTTARTVDVVLHDGTNARYLARDYPVAARGAAGSVINIVAAPVWLPAGWSIRALASAGSALDLVAPYLETST